VHHQFR